jgi:hypothetical protein
LQKMNNYKILLQKMKYFISNNTLFIHLKKCNSLEEKN